jgi:hypothetical protein
LESDELKQGHEFWHFTDSYINAAPDASVLNLLSVDRTPYLPPHGTNWRSHYAREDDELEPTFRGYELSQWMELREMLRGPDIRVYPSPRLLLEVSVNELGVNETWCE